MRGVCGGLAHVTCACIALAEAGVPSTAAPGCPCPRPPARCTACSQRGGRRELPRWRSVSVSMSTRTKCAQPCCRVHTNLRRCHEYTTFFGAHALSLPCGRAELSVLLLFVARLCARAQAATAGSAVWLDYFKLFDESRFVHVTSLDFATLTALMPFWMDNDATARNWDKRWVGAAHTCERGGVCSVHCERGGVCRQAAWVPEVRAARGGAARWKRAKSACACPLRCGPCGCSPVTPQRLLRQ